MASAMAAALKVTFLGTQLVVAGPGQLLQTMMREE
jgi:hypothetical protein